MSDDLEPALLEAECDFSRMGRVGLGRVGERLLQGLDCLIEPQNIIGADLHRCLLLGGERDMCVQGVSSPFNEFIDAAPREGRDLWVRRIAWYPLARVVLRRLPGSPPEIFITIWVGFH